MQPTVASARPVLAPEQSAILRERLLDQLVGIGSADQAALWAQRSLPAKNTLTAEDAKTVEERFQAKLFTIADGQATVGTIPAATPDGLVPDQPPDAIRKALLQKCRRARKRMKEAPVSRRDSAGASPAYPRSECCVRTQRPYTAVAWCRSEPRNDLLAEEPIFMGRRNMSNACEALSFRRCRGATSRGNASRRNLGYLVSDCPLLTQAVEPRQ